MYKKAKLINKIALIVIVFALLSLLVYSYHNKVTADIISSSVSVPSGWSFIDGETLSSVSLDEIVSSGLFLYTFNDPNTKNSGWSYLSNNCPHSQTTNLISCISSLVPIPNLDYLIFNNKMEVSFSRNTSSETIAHKGDYRTGWHILSWNKKDVSRSEFLKMLGFNTTNNTSPVTADYSIDKKYISSNIFQEEIDASGVLIFKELGNKDNSATTSKLNKGNAWVYFQPNSQIEQIAIKESPWEGVFSFGLNVGPMEIDKLSKNKIDFYQDTSELGANIMRYINSDLWVGQRTSDLEKAEKLNKSGMKLMGTWFPMGKIADDRNNSSLVSSTEESYTYYSEVIRDINLYYTSSPEKLKKLLIEQYFKGIVIPRTNRYKDTIKYWQTWNEPNNHGATGIPAEVLLLITTGKVSTATGYITFENEHITVDGKSYDLSSGASGILKQICKDCQLAGGGFSGPDEKYFAILKKGNYLDHVDSEDIHTNMMPGYANNYLKYWTTTLDRATSWLCDGAGVQNCKKPFYSTEAASPSGAKYIDTKYVSNAQVPTGFTMTFSDDFQADDLVKRFVTFPAKGYTSINWNGFYDSHGAIFNGRNCPDKKDSDGWYSFTTPNSLCHHPLKGLYATTASGKYEKKPSYSSYSIATRMLKYASKIEIVKKGNDEHTDIDPVLLFKITDNDGKQKYSAWCEPFWNVNESNLGYKDWNYEDRNCSKSINLNEYGLSGKALVTSRDGSTSGMSANNIALTKSPIFIEAK